MRPNPVISNKRFRLAWLAAFSSLWCASFIIAAGSSPNIVVVAEVYQCKRTTAEPFLRGDKVDADQFADGLQKQAMGFNSTTTVTRLPAITTRSAQRAVVNGKDCYLEVQPVLAPDGETVSVNVVLKISGKNLTTSGNTKFGGTLFLGSLDGSTGDSVQVAFVRALAQP